MWPCILPALIDMGGTREWPIRGSYFLVWDQEPGVMPAELRESGEQSFPNEKKCGFWETIHPGWNPTPFTWEGG